jgi:hypothetical protein
MRKRTVLPDPEIPRIVAPLNFARDHAAPIAGKWFFSRLLGLHTGADTGDGDGRKDPPDA